MSTFTSALGGPPTVTTAQVTLSTIRDRCKERADMVHSSFITDAEWLHLINAAYFELYDLLVQKYGDNYYVQTPYTFTTDGTNDKYSLPTDFYKLIGVDIQLSPSSTGYQTLQRFTMAERNRYAMLGAQVAFGLWTAIRYMILGNQLWFTPLPASGVTMRLLYVPRLTPLVGDSDVLDGISGWEAYVVCDAAMKALIKEESDVAPFMAEKAGLIARIESAAENRDAGNPPTVSDVVSGGYWPGGNGGWGL